jgi:hypothetical protein
MKRRIAGAGLVLATICSLGQAGAAAAGDPSPETAGLRVSANGGLTVRGDYAGPTANDARVELLDGVFSITDTTGASTDAFNPQNPCDQVSFTQVTCPSSALAPSNVISAWTELENDKLTILAAAEHSANVQLGPGADEFQGGAEDDHVTGYWGLNPGGTDGGDLIKTGGGNDELYGDFGPNFGIGGDDELHGEEGGDALSGHAGDDDLYGGPDGDSLAGDFEMYIPEEAATDNSPPGNDLLDGGSGEDNIYAGPGADTVQGGPDRDQILSYQDDGAADDIACGEDPGDYVWFGENDLVASDCEIVLLYAQCPQGEECQALVSVTTDSASGARSAGGAASRLVLAKEKYEIKGRKKLRAKFNPDKVSEALASTDEVDVVRKVVVAVSQRNKKKDATRFALRKVG